MCEDTPDDLVHDLMCAAAYGEHPLAYSILGLKERLLEMTPDDLRAYMNEQYTIENTVISVAGNIDDGLIDLLERHFGAFDNHGQAPELTAPDYQGGLLFHRKKPSRTTSVSHCRACRAADRCSIRWCCLTIRSGAE